MILCQFCLSFSPEDASVSAHILAHIMDISAWMKNHHLQLNLSMPEVLVIPEYPMLSKAAARFSQDWPLKCKNVSVENSMLYYTYNPDY